MILTRDEERNIADCIASARGADEVVVVDSESTDRTRELAQSAGARVVVHPMVNFAEQRNYANTVATCEWVLHLDADERITPKLMTEIRETCATTSSDGFRVPTLNIIFGKPLLHGGWYPSYHVRLQRRERARWARDVHETAGVKGELGTLANPIEHHSHATVSAFIQKLDRYTSMEASEHRGSTLWLAMRTVIEPGPYFVYKYVLQQGFRDGLRGLTIAMLLAFYRSTGYLKVLELRFKR